jgi:hypothetical protein
MVIDRLDYTIYTIRSLAHASVYDKIRTSISGAVQIVTTTRTTGGGAFTGRVRLVLVLPTHEPPIHQAGRMSLRCIERSKNKSLPS